MLLLNPLRVQVLKALKDFNTSYVVIKRKNLYDLKKWGDHFNTSYVVIKHGGKLLKANKYQFQYILCCY